MNFDKLVNQLLKESMIYPEYQGMSSFDIGKKRDAIERKMFKLKIQAEQPEKLKYFINPGEVIEPLTPEEEEFMAATKPTGYINTSIPRRGGMYRGGRDPL
jgi:hypothetical protein